MGIRSLKVPAVGTPTRQSLFSDIASNLGDIYARTLPFVNIKNGGFEIDSDGDGVPDGWTLTPHVNGSIAVSASPAFIALDAGTALKIISPGGIYGGGIAETADHIPAQELSVYNLKWWSFSTVATMRNQVEVVFYDENLNGFSSSLVYDEQTANPPIWTLLARSFTTPSGTRYMRVKLNGGVAGHETGGTVYFDAVDFFTPERIGSTHIDGRTDNIGNYTPPLGAVGAEVLCRFNAVLIGGDESFGTIEEVAVDNIGRDTFFHEWYPMDGTPIPYLLGTDNTASKNQTRGRVFITTYGAVK